jgi:[ribosomal protein S5]-alanine N-acetyltransferase
VVVPALPTLDLGLPGWCLRAWAATDAPSLAAHANNPRVWRNMADTFPQPYTLEIAQHWVARGHIDFGGDNWAIACDDVAVGGCGLHRGAGGERCNVEIGYWLGEPYWGRGVVTQVVRVLTARAFALPEVTRVYAAVHADNPVSMRVLEKNGFRREALLRRSACKGGQVIDRVLWARIDDEAPLAGEAFSERVASHD